MSEPKVRPTWLRRLWSGLESFIRRWRGFIQTGEVTLVLGAVYAAFTLGADILLLVICLAAGWIVAAIGICSSPRLSVAWKLPLTALAAIVITGIGWGLRVHAQNSQDTLASNQLDYKVSLECTYAIRPMHSRDSKPLYLWEVVGAPTKERPIEYVIGNTSFQPGINEIKWGDDFPDQMARCVFTNYSGVPLLRVSARINFEWRDIIRKANGHDFSSGAAIASGEFNTPLFDLGTTVNSEDYFFIFNLSSDTFVSWSLPLTATVYLAGTGERHTVKLIASKEPPPALFPFQHPSKPATATPPTSEQPSSQQGKSEQPASQSTSPPIPGTGAEPSQVNPVLPREYITLDFSDLQKRISQLNGVQVQKIAALYKGRWVKAHGTVGNIRVTGGGNVLILPMYQTRQRQDPDVVFSFETEWGDRVSALKTGSPFSADCKIMDIENHTVTLDHCELK